MNLEREAFETDQEMFSPAFEINDLLTRHPLLINFGITGYLHDLLTFEWLYLFFKNNYGGSFGHTGGQTKNIPAQ